MRSKKDKQVEEIIRRVEKRLRNELGQSGGKMIRDGSEFNSGANIKPDYVWGIPVPGSQGVKQFKNIIIQTSHMLTNSLGAIGDAIDATISVATLPNDFISILDRPNEPLPSNTPISKIISDI